MGRKSGLAWLVSGLLSVLLPLTAMAASNFNDPNFKTTWERVDKPVQDLAGTGRGYTWGPPAPGSEKVASEPYNGGTRKVQYFDKARMEINNPAGNPNDLFYVTTGLLVKELVTGNRQDGDNSFTFVGSSQVQVAGDSNENGANAMAPTYASFRGLGTFSGTENGQSKSEGSPVTNRIDKAGQVGSFTPPEQRLLKGYDPVTQHNVADVFSDYGNLEGLIWNGQSYVQGAVFFGNALYVLGRPITEPYWVRAVVAGTERDVLVQLFERRVLTYTPANPDAFKVEMGNVGQHYYRWRYEQNPTKLLGTSQFLPYASIAGNYAFWLDVNGSVITFQGYDLSKNSQFQIAQTNGGIVYPASDGRFIVWVQSTDKYGGGQQSIQGYDLATGKSFEIIKAAGSTQYSDLSVEGGKVYFQRPYGDNPGFYSHDLATGQESLILANVMNPVFKDGILVWLTSKRYGTDLLSPNQIWLHMLKVDGSLPDTIFATTDPDKDPYPQLSGISISGNKVVWAFYPPETKKFFMYDLNSGKTQKITTSQPVRNPIVNGDKVALTFSPDEGVPDWAVGIYNLTTGSTVTVARSSLSIKVWGLGPTGVIYSGFGENLYFTPLNG